MAKKLILLLSLLFGTFAFADAKDGDIQYLVVDEKKGYTTTFSLSANPYVTFSDNVLHVACCGITLNVALDNLDSYYLSSSSTPTGVEIIQSKNPSSMKKDGSLVYFTGLKRNDVISIYGISGQMLKQTTADGDGNAVISLDGIRGTVILRTPSTSYKITTKQ